jgi:hypothetical protein
MFLVEGRLLPDILHRDTELPLPTQVMEPHSLPMVDMVPHSQATVVPHLPSLGTEVPHLPSLGTEVPHLPNKATVPHQVVHHTVGSQVMDSPLVPHRVMGGSHPQQLSRTSRLLHPITLLHLTSHRLLTVLLLQQLLWAR